MPRRRMTAEERQAAALEKRRTELRIAVAVWCERTHNTKQDLARLCGMPVSTFYKRLDQPESMRAGELWKLQDILGVSA